MATTYDIMKRIQKYDGINLFLVLDKTGKKMNTDIDEEEKKNVPSPFTEKYSEIPKLVNKAVSCCRDIDPLVSLTFLFF